MASRGSGERDGAYAGACLLCGRTAGYLVRRTFYTCPGGVRPERDGPHLRCGDCRGRILLEPEPTFAVPPWVAILQRDESIVETSRRVIRRRAG